MSPATPTAPQTDTPVWLIEWPGKVVSWLQKDKIFTCNAVDAEHFPSKAAADAAIKQFHGGMWRELISTEHIFTSKPAGPATPTPEGLRLDAAVTFLEALQAEGAYLHDISGDSLTGNAFIAVVAKALDRLVASGPAVNPQLETKD